MSDWTEGDVISNRVRLHYYSSGRCDGPAVILSHGVTDEGTCWPELAPVLAEHFHVIAYDARNHGHSEHTRDVYGWDTLGEDEAGLIAALGLAPAILVGHSMAAATEGACAARHPDLVRACVLEDPPWMNQGSVTSGASISRREAYERLQSQEVDAIIAGARINSPLWNPAILPPWAEAKKRFSVSIAELYRPEFSAWPATAEAIQCPVLLITADPPLGARMTRVEREQAAGLLRQGTVVNVAGAGHNIRRDQYAGYMAWVLPFLEQFL